jgi:hypothetical protein
LCAEPEVVDGIGFGSAAVDAELVQLLEGVVDVQSVLGGVAGELLQQRLDERLGQ